MKYDVSIEEALRHLIEKGVPVNIFLKEGGMDELIASFKEQIEKVIQETLETYTILPSKETLQKKLKLQSNDLSKQFEDQPELLNELLKSIDQQNQDNIRRLKWRVQSTDEVQLRTIETLLKNVHNLEIINQAIKQYKFSGGLALTPNEAIKTIQTLDQLVELLRALDDAIESGDLYNLDLQNIAKFLGPESYQEFLERRESIFDKLKELLKNNGNIVEADSGKLDLSPSSIQKIGQRALIEIFSNLKADSSSGSHLIREYGESENTTSETKFLEFGDSISNIDFSSTIINSQIRGNHKRLSIQDIEVFRSRGSAKSATVILLDMSGSMFRNQRFFNAKKVTLAMDALIRKEFKDEKLHIIGFGTIAKLISIAELPSLQPYQVTIYNPYIKLRYDFTKMTREEIDSVPMYFTNLQRGLSLARHTISSKQTKNKQIFLITDGAPTAHFKNGVLHINYPPTPGDFDEALSEVKRCTGDGIVINTFLLTSEWDYNYFGEESFIRQFAKISKGRIFYPHPNELNQMIIYNFISNKKSKFNFA